MSSMPCLGTYPNKVSAWLVHMHQLSPSTKLPCTTLAASQLARRRFHFLNLPSVPPATLQCRRALCDDTPVPKMGFDPERRGAEAASSLGARQDAGKTQAEAPTQAGPFVLRTLLDNIPLSEDGENDNTKINCVDYLGTYQALLLRGPPDPQDPPDLPHLVLFSVLTLDL